MEWIARLRARCPEVEVRPEEPLARHVSFRIGGPAAVMAFPRTEEHLAALLRFARDEGVPAVILGAGTNVLPPDGGLDALVICLLGGLDTLRLLEDGRIEAGAGVTLARCASFACRMGLTGLEFAHGIPGSLGGGLYMNAGAYGGELCQVAAETTVMERDGTLKTFRGAAQGFGYRRSAFQEMDAVIVRAVLALSPGDREAIRAKMQDLAQRRRASQPLNVPSAGSTFRRPQGGYAAALIDQAGLKGLRVGGAVVSEKHAGFVVNDRGGTCADVLTLIRQVQARVYERSGIRLEPEIRIL
ncbi:MAG: UDP-N-acetylmuramate dehydrogenase [Oscillospiraceae bacterium]|nr:UDP-N-acetylmuramate dehydrogenase [Oscillospiraceae bacterium]